MTDAYIYDHVRTPRGKGKKDGCLHQATPVWLLRTLLQALQQRNTLDTALVDDVVLGCVTPVGEQGADIARTAVLDADWAQTVAGVTQSRFCASGLESREPGRGQGRQRLGRPGGGRRCREHEPLDHGQRRRRLVHGPAHQPEAGLRAAGRGRRPDRHAGRLGPRRCGRVRAAFAPEGRRGARCRALRPHPGAGARHRRAADAGRGRDHPRQRHARGAWPSSTPASR